ncbi:MAG TPA: amidohydrolase family protein [Gemmatimonadales bacterium]|nr:amidohydrolase family protein [Gemmatimonadales bacterium]
MRSLAPILVAATLGLESLRAQTPAALAPAVRQYVTVDAPVIALTHVRVIDGTGAPAAADQTVIIADGRIHAVGPAAATAVPAGATVIDGTGKTVIPGLVGMHDHLFYPSGGPGGQRNGIYYSGPRLYLGSGVTTIRTAGTYQPYADLDLKEAIEKGRVPGPHIFASGAYLDQVRGHLRGPDDARRLVDYWADEGSSSFKAYMQISRAELGAAIAEAHKRGLKVTAHLCSVTFREAIALGIDELEHGLLVSTDFTPGKEPDVCPPPDRNIAALAALDIQGPAVQSLIHELVQHGVAITSTLAVFEAGLPDRPPLTQRMLDVLATEPRASYLATRTRLKETAAQSPFPTAYQKELEFERAFVQAGGLLMQGLDPTGTGGSIPGFGDQRGVQLLVEAGFTPEAAIKIATANGAQFLGMLDRFGTVQPGKQADLVLIAGDPATKIGDIENVVTVFKDGVGYDSAKLIGAVRGQLGVN